jgi:hypothetical protein
MSYAIKTLTGERAWFGAPVKTGTQAIKKAIETYCSDINAIGHKFWHTPVEDIYRLEKFRRGHDWVFGSIRNPWITHASNFFYQRDKFNLKLKYADDVETYKKLYPDNYIQPGKSDHYNYYLEHCLGSFEMYVDMVHKFATLHLYKPGKAFRPSKFANYISGRDTTLMTQSRFFAANTALPVRLLKIEEPENIYDFFKQHFDRDITLEYVNVSGYGEKYKDLYTDDLKQKIYEAEQPIIELGEYKY